MSNGYKTDVDCLRTDRIEKIKENIEGQNGVPRTQQLLSFHGLWLGNSQTIAECALGLRPTLDLIVCPPGHLPIVVRLWFGAAPFTRIVAFTDTISEVMHQLEAELGIPQDHSMRLMMVSNCSGICHSPDWLSLDWILCADGDLPLFVQRDDEEPVTVVAHMADSFTVVMNRLTEQNG
jgi:hypothetical protein